MSVPRVAVVGGGIAGTLCSLVLKNRGLVPILIDQAQGYGDLKEDATGGLGGRMRGAGAQFLRATDPRLQVVMGMLENANLIQLWKGRFGMLGSQGGGFLPANIVTAGMGSRAGGVAGLAPADPNASTNDTTAEMAAATDAGDFCQFVQTSDQPTYVGMPSMLHLCPSIAAFSEISTMPRTEVLGASMVSEGGWVLDLKEGTGQEARQHFDALVIATHNPALAGNIVQSIVDAEVKVGGYDSVDDAIEKGSKDGSNRQFPLIMKRLSSLSKHLHKVRHEGKRPLFTVQATYPSGSSEKIPFDAVSVPGSPFLQFMAREGSKPGPLEMDGEKWTAISTSKLAALVLDDKEKDMNEKQEHIKRVLTGEMSQLLGPYFDGEDIPTPTSVYCKRWGAALCGKGLELQEDSITLASWRLGICGDFIRQSAAYPTPWEAAALSGLEAGERMTSVLTQPEAP